MAKRIVIALGGNALGKNLEEQMQAVKTTACAIADLIEDGHEVVIAHGNGPQVGMIQNAFAAYHKQQAKSDIMPLSMCVAMSQGYIGYDLQNMIGEELDRRGLGIHCATVLTQVAVAPADPAFQHPTKPIGAFMTEEEAKKLAAEKGIDVAEDAGRGWRQVVASPRPKEIVEIATVRALMNAKHAVIFNKETGEERAYLIPFGFRVKVFDGDHIKKGDKITDGAVNPHDILDILGPEAVMNYLISEVQSTYRLQGVETVSYTHLTLPTN